MKLRRIGKYKFRLTRRGKGNDSLTPIRNMVVNWHRLFSIAGCVEATTFGEELRGQNNMTPVVVNLGLSLAMLKRHKLE